MSSKTDLDEFLDKLRFLGNGDPYVGYAKLDNARGINLQILNEKLSLESK